MVEGTGAGTTPCRHGEVACVNPFELIRKYRCGSCGEIMMCGCDQEFGETFLQHQLAHGRDLDTGLEIPVSLGFQDQVCQECRGGAPEARPKAELYGRASKIVRYYWREIFFETTRRFAEWAEDAGVDWSVARHEYADKQDEIERTVIDEFKAMHAVSPKYQYQEASAAEVLSRAKVDIVDLGAQYVHSEPGARRLITRSGSYDSPEELTAAHFKSLGFSSIDCESRPFHVLFGVYLWLVVQDPADELRDVVSFGERSAFEAGRTGEEVVTFLPRDFGKPGYSRRRAVALEEHFRLLQDDLSWLFDYWLEPSAALRQYLWAHRDADVERARKVIDVLPADVIRKVLRYLVDSYWKRYLGWPDLLVFDSTSYLFVEVKGSGDKLSEHQKRWVRDNADILGLPFKLAKVHRER